MQKYNKLKNILKVIIIYSKEKLRSFWFYDICSLRRKNLLLLNKKHVLKELKKSGFFVLKDYYSEDECKQIIKNSKKDIKVYEEYVHSGPDKRLFGIEKVNKLINKLFSDKYLLEIGELINKEKTVCSFTLFNWLESGNKSSSGDGWHRDAYLSQYKALVYLSDVNIDNGPFEIIPDSHTFWSVIKLMKNEAIGYFQNRYNQGEIKLIKRILGKDSVPLIGKAGTLIIFNSSSIHRGKPILKGERFALTNYYFPESRDNEKLIESFNPIKF